MSIRYKLPKKRSINSNDPKWMRELKTWCNEVVEALNKNRRLRGDGENITIEGDVIKPAKPSDEQFAARFDGINANGQKLVRVNRGWHMTPYGDAGWPASGEDSDVVTITGTGWVITRQAKSGPGALEVVFQATRANPASTTHYESNVCMIEANGNNYTMKHTSRGERNFVPTL